MGYTEKKERPMTYTNEELKTFQKTTYDELFK